MRLVDADEVKKYLYEHLDDLHMIAAQNAIDEMPTIDAQPVKHGIFVFEKGDYRNTVDGYRCTSCGETYHTKVPYFSEYKFCPKCGAKMDGDG